MKNTFSHFYLKTTSEIDDIWNDSIIVPDTNVFLNLYSYSKSTRDKILKIMKVLAEKDRIRLLYQVGVEYHNNRLKAVGKQKNKYKDHMKAINDVKKIVFDEIKTPLLDSELNKEFDAVLERVLKKMNHEEVECDKLLRNDLILVELEKIFSDKVSKNFTKDELTKIYEDSHERYKRKIPPGYKDEGKDENNYGDLIIWKQIIDLAIEEKKSIIFITEDNKNDWWFRDHSGKNIMARPELLLEFKTELNKNNKNKEFYILSTENFLKESEKYLKIKVDDKVIEEVEKVSELHEESNTIKEYRKIHSYSSGAIDHEMNIARRFDFYNKKAEECYHNAKKLKFHLSTFEGILGIDEKEKLKEELELCRTKMKYYSDIANEVRKKYFFYNPISVLGNE